MLQGFAQAVKVPPRWEAAYGYLHRAAHQSGQKHYFGQQGRGASLSSIEILPGGILPA